MANLIQKCAEPVVITCEEAGRAFAWASEAQQREFLIAMANEVDRMCEEGGSWALQCRAIVDGCWKGDGLSVRDRERISSALSTLIDHLNERA